MENQVEQAVEIALSSNADPALKQQAMAFCNQLKDSDDGWQMCLSLFMSDRKRSPAVRFFALQVVDSALLKRINGTGQQLDETSFMYIKNALLSYIQNEYQSQSGSDSDSDAVFMQNKLAQTLTYFFLLSYPHSWPTFFDDLLALTSENGVPLGNARGIQFFLRVLLAQHDEIADTLILRPNDEMRRNSAIKDAIRVNDMAKLANVWMEILVIWTSRDNRYLVIENCLRVIGSWVSWIDISLIVTPQYMSIIFGILQNETLRGAACDALSEIISKKMKPSDKLELISLLNIPQTVGSLSMGNDIEFAEKVARLTNVVCLDLIKIIDDDQVPPQLKENVENLLSQLFPYAINFLANEYDDTSSEVFPAVSEYLSFLRKEKKRNVGLSPGRLSILTSILKTVIQKLKYDDELEWNSGADDSENEFLEFRSKLRLFQDAIAAIDGDLFMESISSVVIDSLDGSKQDWRDVELGLFELGAYSDGLKNASALVTKGQTPTKAVEILNNMLLKLTSSNVLSLGHPSIHLQYMELVVKNVKFFETHPQLIPSALEMFVSQVGIHSSNQQVQVRSWYLFYRFGRLCKNLIGDISETALNAIGDLLVIHAEVPKSDSDSDISDGGAGDTTSFDSRLYLFEIAGVLISVEAVPDEKQAHLLISILDPIFQDIQNSFPNATQDRRLALQIHHDIMAIGRLGRGIVDGGKKISDAVQEQYLLASRVILVSLETLSGLEIIRDASRFAFARMVPVLQQHILPEIPVLLSRLLSESSTSELIDFMSFLGQLIHSFKGQPGIMDMLDSLFGPLVSRIFYSLSISADGSTDVEIEQNEMKKVYFNFVMGMLNNNMEAVLVSETNRQLLGSVMQSVAHYTSTSTDAFTKKLGNSIYSRLEGVQAKGY
ncbi:armadillo-type protein [Lipomyces arxii]|uniref:armadillo-type protein n=1 Tax=Lipomyces arxii TaxID=56418 RepID=UPI0034CFF946